jgi:hypothetical protein
MHDLDKNVRLPGFSPRQSALLMNVYEQPFGERVSVMQPEAFPHCTLAGISQADYLHVQLPYPFAHRYDDFAPACLGRRDLLLDCQNRTTTSHRNEAQKNRRNLHNFRNFLL